MQPYLALITPLASGGHPDNSLPPVPGQPPGIWPSPGHPAHPIAPGGPPPGIWPSPGYPDNSLPVPPGIWPSPGHPAHPIAPGGPPPGIWPGPGVPTHPIVIPPDAIAPGVPSHPIYWPPKPDNTLPGGEPSPEHPIIIPGDDPANPKWEVKAAWTPQAGWIVVVVPTDEATVPTPSA